VSSLDKSSIHSVEISTIAHATEDPGRVESALRELASGVNQPFTRRYIEGHHHNPIITFQAKLDSGKATEFATSFIRQLSGSERVRIIRDLALHCDAEGNLYVRVDKQKLFRGEFQLGDDDPIRIKIKFSRLTGNPTDTITRFLELE